MLVMFTCEVASNFTFDITMKNDLERVAKQKKWPAAYIHRIDLSGLMVVKFK